MKILSIQEEPFHEINYISSGSEGALRECSLPFFKASVDKLPENTSAIALTSDLQGREGRRANRLLGELVSEDLFLLQELGEVPHISVVILAGDLYDYPDLNKLGGTGDTTPVWNSFAYHFPLVLGVMGNHDLVEADLLDRSVIILDNSCYELGDTTVSGISGIIGRIDKNQRKTAKDFICSLNRLLKKGTDLIVLHQGPDYPEDNQLGEPLIRKAIEESGSGLVIFGHCHWSEPLGEIGKNQVLNVDNRVIILVEGDIL